MNTKGQQPAKMILFLLAFTTAAAGQVDAADLSPKTVAAFDRYVSLTEARMDQEGVPGRAFLWIDTLPEPQRKSELARLERGEIAIERLETRDRGRDINVPDGLLHHWVGTVFIHAPLREVLRVLQDYDHHNRLFAPAVVRSVLRSRTGDDFKVHLRFFRKKIVTVVIDTENDIHYSSMAQGRAQFRARSTHVAEVDQVGTPSETVRPAGKGHGFMWRLNTYGRFEERDGGTLAQFETITLSRDIPFGLGWMIGPFVTSVPRESLEFTLDRLRQGVMADSKTTAALGK